MSFLDRIAEALAGTQTIAVIGDDVRDDLYREAVDWGFQLSSVKASELNTFGKGHPLWGCKSKAHWLLMIEDAHLLNSDQEDPLLDLAFDGCSALPENTLIALHFAHEAPLVEIFDDPAVPITVLQKTPTGITNSVAAACRSPVISPAFVGANAADLRGLPLAA